MNDNKQPPAWSVEPLAYLEQRAPEYQGARLFSRYVEVRDGTRLAVDVHLPGTEAADAAYPVVLCLTPYYRRFALRPGHHDGIEACPNLALYRDALVPRGYALVGVDVRGTGASFGARDGFRSPRERLDHHDIADWVAAQPWCDGNIGATGISYLGAASDFLAGTNHPAVKAVAPLFAVWDTWSNHLYPGGVLCNIVSKRYGDLADVLDHDDRARIPDHAYFADPDLTGPAPVDDDGDGSLLTAALHQHQANFDMQDFAQQLRYRDAGLSDDPDYTSARISPYHYANRPADRDTACYSISGWMDGAGYSLGTIQRYQWLRNPANRLLLGPWDHGARGQVSPWRRQAGEPQQPFVMAEVLRFFDRHLRGDSAAAADEAPVHYYLMGAEEWRAAGQWPPPGGEQRLFLAPEGELTAAAPNETTARDAYAADFDCRTGFHSRYDRLYVADVETYYDDWHGRDRAMLCYTGAPLTDDTEVTGHPWVHLHFTCSEKDCAFFVYLEDVTPEGRSIYVTEGIFRALHRRPGDNPPTIPATGPSHSFRQADAALLVPGEVAEAAFELLPTSYLFRRGHAIRLAIAASDSDHYSRIPDGRPPLLEFLRDKDRPSHLVLPVVAGG
ncbi:MAG: CocE/NonD family hydrolase [Alphaproteobacteria bacterium]|jgi:hypothetical protein|nr:CocE/NonD family hydrolase [Alphaproteobacteria bacterium]MDP6566780.1 CocE/NonD family hydrolase [Alphaproteobacteria bacterium]MDP6812280.1 CocE/NonD family hydrolase [Alphaproteobacteria bacterium]